MLFIGVSLLGGRECVRPGPEAPGGQLHLAVQRTAVRGIYMHILIHTFYLRTNNINYCYCFACLRSSTFVIYTLFSYL